MISTDEIKLLAELEYELFLSDVLSNSGKVNCLDGLLSDEILFQSFFNGVLWGLELEEPVSIIEIDFKVSSIYDEINLNSSFFESSRDELNGVVQILKTLFRYGALWCVHHRRVSNNF